MQMAQGRDPMESRLGMGERQLAISTDRMRMSPGGAAVNAVAQLTTPLQVFAQKTADPMHKALATKVMQRITTAQAQLDSATKTGALADIAAIRAELLDALQDAQTIVKLAGSSVGAAGAATAAR
jgi:hypothetical protein